MTLTPKQKTILEASKRYFEEGFYDKVTPLLNTLVAQKVSSPDVYHMLGTIYYEQGQFKASIGSFKKALNIDPDFTDSSIGLSVVLNDLGKYDKAREVFLEAQNRLKGKNSTKPKDSLLQSIAQKHRELSELYIKANKPKLAFQNLIDFEELSSETLETVLEKAKLQRMMSNFKFAAEILKSWWQEGQTTNSKFFIELTELYYLDRQPLKALSSCEFGLKKDAQNPELKNLYKNLTQTNFDLRQPEANI